jgi:hypothetical protein
MTALLLLTNDHLLNKRVAMVTSNNTYDQISLLR